MEGCFLTHGLFWRSRYNFIPFGHCKDEDICESRLVLSLEVHATIGILMLSGVVVDPALNGINFAIVHVLYLILLVTQTSQVKIPCTP